MEIKRREYEEEFNQLALRMGSAFTNEQGYRNMQKYIKS